MIFVILNLYENILDDFLLGFMFNCYGNVDWGVMYVGLRVNFLIVVCFDEL